MLLPSVRLLTGWQEGTVKCPGPALVLGRDRALGLECRACLHSSSSPPYPFTLTAAKLCLTLACTFEQERFAYASPVVTELWFVLVQDPGAKKFSCPSSGGRWVFPLCFPQKQ